VDAFFLLAALGSAGALAVMRALRPRSALIPYIRDCLIVFAAMFVLRCFFYEWFRIPSSSMEPTLRAGDFVIVDKNDYGVSLPFVDGKLTEGRLPSRGEIAVFRYPSDPGVFYIKRVIGLPGDRLSYREDRVYVEGERLGYVFPPEPPGAADGEIPLTASEVAWEGIPGEGWHAVRLSRRLIQNALYPIADREPGCETRQFVEFRSELACEIPEGHLFVLGDNRHHSSDSRVWGFVPVGNLVGPAFRIIFSVSGLERIGNDLSLAPEAPEGLVPDPGEGVP